MGTLSCQPSRILISQPDIQPQMTYRGTNSSLLILHGTDAAVFEVAGSRDRTERQPLDFSPVVRTSLPAA